MKRHAKPAERRDRAAEPASVELRIEFDSEVLRRIRQHARSSMSAEICGVLIGSAADQATIVEASIPGEEARQGGSHVTFTQDTWTHIYQVKDSQYPDKRIVGWYHSHPGFGIFLSEHDTFIHRNFFSNANQIAWVFDPHSDEEGCFAWRRDEIVRVTQIAVRDQLSGADPLVRGRPPGRPFPDDQEADEGVGRGPGGPPHGTTDAPDGRRRLPGVARWIGLVLSHLLALILGFGIGFLLAPPVIMVPDRGAERPGIAAPAPQVQPPAGAREDQKK
jgi:proteasome lid subunit RPN8/RPN11